MAEGLLAGRVAAVLTASDRCFAGLQIDRSGPAVQTMLESAGATVREVVVVADEPEMLQAQLRSWIREKVPLVVTTGGTGLAPRDHTPEVTEALCQRFLPGLPELIRREGMRQTPFAALSRGICGVAEQTLILNLPGSPEGAKAGLGTVLKLLPHALDLIAGRTAHPASVEG